MEFHGQTNRSNPLRLLLSGLPPPPPVQACGSVLTLGCAGFGSC